MRTSEQFSIGDKIGKWEILSGPLMVYDKHGAGKTHHVVRCGCNLIVTRSATELRKQTSKSCRSCAMKGRKMDAVKAANRKIVADAYKAPITPIPETREEFARKMKEEIMTDMMNLFLEAKSEARNAATANAPADIEPIVEKLESVVETEEKKILEDASSALSKNTHIGSNFDEFMRKEDPNFHENWRKSTTSYQAAEKLLGIDGVSTRAVLEEAVQTGKITKIKEALNHVFILHGWSEMQKRTGKSLHTLIKMFKKGQIWSFENVTEYVQACGFKLKVEEISHERP